MSGRRRVTLQAAVCIQEVCVFSWMMCLLVHGRTVSWWGCGCRQSSSLDVSVSEAQTLQLFMGQELWVDGGIALIFKATGGRRGRSCTLLESFLVFWPVGPTRSLVVKICQSQKDNDL